MKSTNKDPYLHENGCLKNILQITDKEQLRKEEIKRFRKALRCVLAENHPFSIVATKNFYYELHHELFGAIYEWAGQPRVID